MKPPPPLNYIRSFESSARHLSFTLAAKELGYTQAAVSTHVRALEHYIGRQLFIRYPRSLKLTEMGEAFLPTLRQALGLVDAGMLSMDGVLEKSCEAPARMLGIEPRRIAVGAPGDVLVVGEDGACRDVIVAGALSLRHGVVVRLAGGTLLGAA